MITSNERFEKLGFIADVPEMRNGKFTEPYKAYIKDLSPHTSLFVEGYKKKGYSTYRYSFYKVTYIKGGRKINQKVYAENVSLVKVLRQVTSFLHFIEKGVKHG